MRSGLLVGIVIAGALGAVMHATEPDTATRRWWSHVQALAEDGMRGRDTGSPEHRRAQEYVVRHLEQAGLRAAGERGVFQSVPLRSYRLRIDRSQAGITRNGRAHALRWLRDISVAPAKDLTQPWVPEAAAKFNEFFARLVTTLANADDAPRWKAGSPFAVRPPR